MFSKISSWGQIDPANEAISYQIKTTLFHAVLTTVGILAMGCYIIVNASSVWVFLPSISSGLLLLGLGSFLALRLEDRSFLAARLAWLTGAAACLGLLQYTFPRSGFYGLLGLLPMLALVVSLRLVWSLVGLGALVLLGLVLVPPDRAGDVPFGLLVAVTSTSVVYFTASALVSTTVTAIENYRKMRSELEEARRQRMELLDMQENYHLANKELTRLNERLAVVTQYAEEAKQIKEEFVARVSHELRTPLNMVIGFSEVIMLSPQIYGDSIPPALLADVDAIQRNSQHLTRLVDDILDLSQVEAGKMVLTKEWITVEEVVAEAASVIRGLDKAPQAAPPPGEPPVPSAA